MIECNQCGMLQFWIFKVKPKFKIINTTSVEYDSKTTFKILHQWDGPMTPFIFEKIMKSSEVTGRPLESYYLTYKFEPGNIVKEHRLDFKPMLDRIGEFEERVLKSD